MGDLPRRITISEVGPRDGLQMEATTVSTADKIALIDKLVAAGIDRIEVSAFVHPKVVPQMADAEQVFAGIHRRACVTARSCPTPRAPNARSRRAPTTSRSGLPPAIRSTRSTCA